MSLRLITPAATYPVTLAEAKAQCRVDGTDDDTYLNGLIAAATAHVEQYTGRAIVSQTWELVLDEFADAMMIPKGPVTAITSVKYYDADSIEQTVTDTNYSTDLVSDPQWVVKVSDYSWPTTADGVNVVTIRFVAGYSTVPADLKHAILFLIGQYYDQRAGVSDKPIAETPHAVAALLCNYRSFAF